MRFKLLLLAFGFISTAAMAQSQVPPGVNASRYTYCMSEGLGKGRAYTTPQAFCQQWAGPSAASMVHPNSDMGNGIQCGMSWNGNPIYMSPSRCEAYLNAAKAAEIAQHKAWLAQQAAQAKAAAAAAAVHAPAFYNCTWSLLMGYDFGPQYDTQNVPEQIVATSLNEANAKANKYVQSLGWSSQGKSSCSYLVAVP